MGLFDFFKKKKATIKDIQNIYYDGAYRSQSREKPMLLSTIYRCVDVISDLAILPIKIYEVDADGFKKEAKDHPLYWLLNNEPNEDMTRYTFIKTAIASALLNGNAYAFIDRDESGTPRKLVYLPADNVSIVYDTDSKGIKHKKYRVQGSVNDIDPFDMMHILNFTYNGIEGVSTLTHAAQTIGLASSMVESSANFFSSGSAMSGILKINGVGTMSKERKDDNYAEWARRRNSKKSGGIVILEGNMDYQPITISNRDSQFLESRQFTSTEISTFFGVSPVKCFDLTHSSYSTIEASQLQFLTDTLQPWITKIEQELNRKMLLPSDRTRYVIEMDTTELLRADKSTLASYYTAMYNMAALTPNEIRKQNNLPRVEGGDTPMVQVNMQTLTNAAKALPDDNAAVDNVNLNN